MEKNIIKMHTCYFCKKKYEGYAVILCCDIECFLMEEHVKDIYYDEKTGICKKCREEHIDKNPVFMIQAWLTVRCQIELARIKVKEKKDEKLVKRYIEALKRIDKYEKILEKTKEVKEIYMKNNPAMFKRCPRKKKKCDYCGENYGQKWINDPNQEEPTIDKCWWICVTCDKIMELQKRQGGLYALKGAMPNINPNTKGRLLRDIKKTQEEIDKISYEDGLETCSIVLKKRTK